VRAAECPGNAIGAGSNAGAGRRQRGAGDPAPAGGGPGDPAQGLGAAARGASADCGPHAPGCRARRGLMAIGVKVMRRPEREMSYLRATLKGMALTFRHMGRKEFTMQYPEERSVDDKRGTWTISPRWRGTHRMLTD